MGSPPLDEIRAQRFAYLRAVYDETDGTTGAMVQMSEIGTSLRFEEPLTDKIVTYLIDEGLLDWFAIGGWIELTHWGLKEVEEVLSAPQLPTDHFLPLVVAENVLQVGTMNNSLIQQGTIDSVQTMKSADVERLRTLIGDLQGLVSEMALNADQVAEIEAELATATAQLGSPRPEQKIIRESLGSVRTILELAAGGGLLESAPWAIHALDQAINSLLG